MERIGHIEDHAFYTVVFWHGQKFVALLGNHRERACELLEQLRREDNERLH